MAIVNVSSIIYEPVGPKQSRWAAQIECPANNTYVINLQNNVSRNDDAIDLHFACVDNVGNSAGVGIQLGTYSFTVPPFTRETFELPEDLSNLQMTVNTGTVTLTVSQDRLASDQTNSLAVQQTAASTLTYSFIGPFAVTTAQDPAHVNKSIVFNPTVADIAYNLLLGSNAGNGWLEFGYNFGTKNVLITPNAPNTINGVAGAYTIPPGASFIMEADGANWYVGLVSYGSQPGSVKLGGGTIAASGGLALDLSGFAYTEFELRLDHIVPAVNGDNLAARFSITAGASFITTATYRWATFGHNSAAVNATNGSNADTSIVMSNGGGFSNAPGVLDSSAVIRLNGFNKGVGRGAVIDYDIAYANAGPTQGKSDGAGQNTTANINGLLIFFGGGNVTTMDWKLYGIN